METIQNLGNKIIQNQLKECEWNDKMLTTENESDFRELIAERSRVIRELFKENEEIIHEFDSYLEELTDERANAFCEVVRAMHLAGAIDKGLICKLADPVIAYYKEKGIEEEKTIILTLVRSSAVFEYYNRMDYSYKFEESIANLQWVIDHKDKYCDYSDIRVRGNILMAYTNMISFYIEHRDAQNLQKAIVLLKEADALFSDEKVQKLDGEHPIMAFIGDNLHLHLPFQIGVNAINQRISVKGMFEICEDYCISHLNHGLWNEQLMTELVVIAKKYQCNELTKEDAIEDILQMMEGLPDTDWVNNPAESQIIFQYFGFCFILLKNMLGLEDYSVKDREAVIQKIRSCMNRMVANLPYYYNNSYINGILQSFFAELIYYDCSKELVEEMTDQLMIQRQLSTYFHSMMVEEIAALIAEEIIEKKAELFTSLPEYPDADAVYSNKAQLINSIRRAAKIHDLGKCHITSVIMQQSRRLFDDEFACIKGHPLQGVEYLKNLSGYELNKDVILGHHKTYDGKGGYPASFDNTKSAYRIVIDLISISDSADAATDIMGRNYTLGKDFFQLLNELKAEAGSRYNPDIVQVIADSPRLIEKLSILTKEDRLSYLYKVYHQ